MRTIIAILLFLFAVPTIADVGFNQGSHLVFHIASRHSSEMEVTEVNYGIIGRPAQTRKLELNEVNPGLSVRHGIDIMGLFAVGGFYKNSFYKTSLYAGIGKTFFSVGPFAFTLVGGAATGYIERLTPAIIPEFSIHYKQTSFIVGYIPGIRYRETITIPAFTFSVAASF